MKLKLTVCPCLLRQSANTCHLKRFALQLDETGDFAKYIVIMVYLEYRIRLLQVRQFFKRLILIMIPNISVGITGLYRNGATAVVEKYIGVVKQIGQASHRYVMKTAGCKKI